MRVKPQIADSRAAPAEPPKNDGAAFYLVEHGGGWSCTRLQFLPNGRVLLCCPELPSADRELRRGEQVRVLGRVDAELRPVGRKREESPAREPATAPVPATGRMTEMRSLKDLLQRSRQQAGLSFREASRFSRLLADRLSDKRYFAAASTLSDYEVLSAPPRQLQKIVTLCVLYAIRFEQMLLAAGLPLENEGRESMPDALLGRERIRRPGARSGDRPTALEAQDVWRAILGEWEEVPVFLRFCLADAAGIRPFSISSVFCLENRETPRHPLLASARFIAVNRRSTHPPSHLASGWQDRLYVILKRDGSYDCGHATIDQEVLTLHGHGMSAESAQRFRNRADAEVVGQVTAILRRFA